ncbi:MAG: ATP-binding cassette domain-containing protein [Candidatus Eremiobacteraeota bacterium]|nr:ATP-binding cassette domain-containing protein [Candidatus Eremiobacteraeota bacterium]
MLEVERVTKRFGALTAVSNLSFAAKGGAVFGLLGPNGAGKTTTIRMILDIFSPDSGTIRWDGGAIDARRRRSFGYLPEERGLYPKMRAGDQLLFLARLHGVDADVARRRIDELAAGLGLTEQLRKTPAELSKGNQQKVQFIAAVAHEPPLLVLDEPFSGFDPVNVEIVKQSIRDLVARGTAVLLSSHRMEQVEELCEDICIIDRSRAVLAGKLRDIKRNWPDRFLRMSGVADTKFLAAFSADTARTDPDGYLNLTVSPHVRPADVLRAAVAAGPVDYFQVVEPTLNDIYLHAVKAEAATA